jgi:glycosyltransferase involved in cell wall biosynthesis
MPVSSGDDLAPEPNQGEPGVVMVVGDRADKGLDTVVAALRSATGWTRFDVVAPPSAELERRLAPLQGRTRIIAPVTGAAFDAVLRQASLLIAAYPAAVRAKMAPTGIGADALRNAIPLVASDYLAEQFPTGYGGLVTCRPDDPASLSAAIDDALARIDELRAAAWEQGVPFAAHELSWPRYVSQLVELGTS